MQLDPAVLALLNRQINAEQYAVSLYLAIGTWADAQGFEGLSAWALGESADEMAHARKFLDYTNDRATATLTAIAPPPVAFDDYAGALQVALDAERAVSASLVELAGAAFVAGDYATHQIAADHILAEQVPAEKRLAVALQRVARGAPIDLLDAELWEAA
jgi:ferritin